MSLNFAPKCMATGSGGLPHPDVEAVCKLVLEYFPETPYIPFTIRGTRWYPVPAYRIAEGMPCLVVDLDKQRAYFDTSDPDHVEEELVAFYDRYLAQDIDYFAISPERDPGMFLMLEMLRRSPTRPKMVRYSVSGPITFCLRVTDEKGKPIFYNESLRDAIVKALAMKAKWQEREIRRALPDVPTVTGLAEPMLQAYSSAYASIAREDIINAIDEVLTATSGVNWIHCCANIDWSLLLDTKADVIHFDAYEYAANLALFPRELKDFFARGGALGWGIVPTTDEKVALETGGSLANRLEESMQLMVNRGIDRTTLLDMAFVSPSCATTTMSPDMAIRAYRLSKEVSEIMRNKYSLTG